MKIPVLATRGVVNFPGYKTIIEVGRQNSTNAIIESLTNFSSSIIILSQKNPTLDEITSEKDLYTIGTLATFNIEERYATGGMRIEVNGLERVKVSDLEFKNNMIFANKKSFNDIVGDEIKEQALVRKISTKIEKSVTNLVNLPKNILQELATGISAGELADIVGQFLPIKLDKKIQILSTRNINKRLELVISILGDEEKILEIEKEIDNNVRKTLDKQQREYLLRERMKTIKEELGEISSKDSEISEIRKKLENKKYSKEVKDKILDEVKKYEAMPPISAEANVSKSYIEWLIKLPWSTYSKDSNSLSKAEKALELEHYGLEKVKERIIEYLAVKMNTNSLTAPIICLVGPPGVGKTSLASSIAKAIDKKFVKVSLGGVRDEAEIRGHRRTYVGSMPGKIIQAVNKSKTSNPVILLDEIDKMASDYKGDPTSAMLEVLDPEQNSKFQDHYLELEYDLSKAMFIATANYYENIPHPLLDRVEIINLSSYTLKEKKQIAKKHLIKKVLKENGINEKEFKISDSNLGYLIEHYTQEAGVRNLKRILDKIIRKLVVKKINGETLPKEITKEVIKELLGKKIYEYDLKEKKPIIGQVTGLAYTQYGGTTLPVEVTTFKGKGDLKITGQLKDVMNESAGIALTFVKANAKAFGITFDFASNDLHIHVPEGAIPKDGPSAGVTFTTAIISALTGKGVSPDYAMTGEITLRGKVLAIGGLKEKSLAAVRMGVKTIFIPKNNEKDIKELPKEIKDKLEILPISNYNEISNILFK
ncbi:MAG: endopeptidase La [Mycoplasma sp.]|nr:endopeptidase La [Mycoplasma sp.]